MGNINIRIDDKTESALKKEAKTLGISLSDLVREKITGQTKSKSINEITLESRIEALEEQQHKLSETLYFQTRFLYHFTVIAANDETAANAWEMARKEIKNKE